MSKQYVKEQKLKANFVNKRHKSLQRFRENDKKQWIDSDQKNTRFANRDRSVNKMDKIKREKSAIRLYKEISQRIIAGQSSEAIQEKFRKPQRSRSTKRAVAGRQR